MDEVRVDTNNHGNLFSHTAWFTLDLIDFIVIYSLQYKPVVENGDIIVLIVNNPHNVLCFKDTVRLDWICMRVVSLESPLKQHQPLYVFNFLFLILNIL